MERLRTRASAFWGVPLSFITSPKANYYLEIQKMSGKLAKEIAQNPNIFTTLTRLGKHDGFPTSPGAINDPRVLPTLLRLGVLTTRNNLAANAPTTFTVEGKQAFRLYKQEYLR